MRRSSKKLPKDTNQRAAEIVRLSTEESIPIQTEPVTAYLAAIGRKGGLKGGRVRAERLSDEERSKNASDAANARWHPKKK